MGQDVQVSYKHTYAFWADAHSLIVFQHARNDDRHFPGTLEAQNVLFLDHQVVEKVLKANSIMGLGKLSYSLG